MNKNEFIVPIVVIFLSGVFALVSLMVFLSKGSSSFWISKKIKIGALLLTLTAVTQQSCETTTSSCYAPPAIINEIEIAGTDNNNNLKVNLDIDNQLSCIIQGRESSYYSFNITNIDGSDTIQRSDINALDGSFDSYVEPFNIDIDTTIQNGNYNLNFYAETAPDQTLAVESFNLEVANEN